MSEQHYLSLTTNNPPLQQQHTPVKNSSLPLPADDIIDEDLYNFEGSSNQNNNPTAGRSQQNPPTTIEKVSTREAPVTKIPEALTDENWNVWKNHICPIFHLCDLEGYIYGTIPCPANGTQAIDWTFNDNYTKLIIMNNLTSSEMIHIGKCQTAHLM